MVEDGGTFEQAQTMLGSGTKREIMVGDEEILIRHLPHVIDGCLRA